MSGDLFDRLFPSKPVVEKDVVAAAINAASYAASNVVYEYANQYRRRGDYLALEGLAERVQRAAVEAGAAVARDRGLSDSNQPSRRTA